MFCRESRMKLFNGMLKTFTKWEPSKFDVFSCGIDIGLAYSNDILKQENTNLKLRLLELQYSNTTENVDIRIKELKQMNVILIETLATLNKKL